MSASLYVSTPLALKRVRALPPSHAGGVPYVSVCLDEADVTLPLEVWLTLDHDEALLQAEAFEDAARQIRALLPRPNPAFTTFTEATAESEAELRYAHGDR